MSEGIQGTCSPEPGLCGPTSLRWKCPLGLRTLGPREMTREWRIATSQGNLITWEPWGAVEITEGEVGGQEAFASLLFLQVVSLTEKANPG